MFHDSDFRFTSIGRLFGKLGKNSLFRGGSRLINRNNSPLERRLLRVTEFVPVRDEMSSNLRTKF